MDYALHYDRLIERARERQLSGYFERHHIVPRCMGGGDEPANIVKLTAEEHFVAHQLLVKMFPLEPQLIWATQLMATRPGNKLYGWMRRRMSEARQGRVFTPEHIAKIQKGREWWAPTEEHKARVSAALTGIKRSPETRAKMRAAAKRRGMSPACREAARRAAMGPRGQYPPERGAAISEGKRKAAERRMAMEA